MTRQKFETLTTDVNRLDNFPVGEVCADTDESWDVVWERIAGAYKDLGQGELLAMRAVSPLSSSWLPQHLFDSIAQRRAETKALRR